MPWTDSLAKCACAFKRGMTSNGTVINETAHRSLASGGTLFSDRMKILLCPVPHIVPICPEIQISFKMNIEK